MKKCFFYSIAILMAVCVFTNCNDGNIREGELPLDKKELSTVEAFLGQSILDDISKSTEEYTQTLHEVLNHYSGSTPGSVTHEELEKFGNGLYQRGNVSTRSSSGYVITMDAGKLQLYLSELPDKLNGSLDSSEPNSTDEVITRFEKVANEFYAMLLSDVTLTDSEKTDVIVASMLIINVLNANIENLEQIHYLTSGDVITRGLFSWLTKAVKCAIGIVGAIGGGVISAGAPFVGAPIAVGGFTLAASNC